jgi:hypothetical protein
MFFAGAFALAGWLHFTNAPPEETQLIRGGYAGGVQVPLSLPPRPQPRRLLRHHPAAYNPGGRASLYW